MARRYKDERDEWNDRGWWYYNGPAVRVFVPLYIIFIGIPMTVLFICNPAEAWEKARQIGIAAATVVVITAAAMIYYRNDPH